MKDSLFMGIDIGTSGIRAAIFDGDGLQISLFHEEYPMICSEKDMAELDPEVVFKSLMEVVSSCTNQIGDLAKRIEAIGLSTQMHSFLAVDKEGNCLTNVITWADTRAYKQAEFIKAEFDCGSLYNSTGCRVQHPMYPLSKILWLRDERKDVFSKAYKFITIKEFIIYKLFGQFIIDITDASATGCFNIHSFTWDEEILSEVLKVDSSKFGEPAECTFILKDMDKQYAEKMGLRSDIPVVIGSGDGIMANVGCGVFNDKSMSSTIGTSGALRIAVDKPLLDKQQRTWCYCFTRHKWVAGGAINNGGIVLRWLRDDYKKQYEHEMEDAWVNNIYKLFDMYAQEIKPGSEGLLFLPYLTGERSPGWNAGARGTIHGLQLIHGKKHFIRAAMEGVIYNLFSVYEVITQINSNVQQVIANGGYANSNIWLQIQADIFDKEIAIAGIGEASVFGAAYTAMAAVGAISGLDTMLPYMKPSKVVTPIKENVEVYKDAYRNFRDMYYKLYGNR